MADKGGGSGEHMNLRWTINWLDEQKESLGEFLLALYIFLGKINILCQHNIHREMNFIKRAWQKDFFSNNIIKFRKTLQFKHKQETDVLHFKNHSYQWIYKN